MRSLSSSKNNSSRTNSSKNSKCQTLHSSRHPLLISRSSNIINSTHSSSSTCNPRQCNIVGIRWNTLSICTPS